MRFGRFRNRGANGWYRGRRVGARFRVRWHVSTSSAIIVVQMVYRVHQMTCPRCAALRRHMLRAKVNERHTTGQFSPDSGIARLPLVNVTGLSASSFEPPLFSTPAVAQHDVKNLVVSRGFIWGLSLVYWSIQSSTTSLCHLVTQHLGLEARQSSCKDRFSKLSRW